MTKMVGSWRRYYQPRLWQEGNAAGMKLDTSCRVVDAHFRVLKGTVSFLEFFSMREKAFNEKRCECGKASVRCRSWRR